MGGAKLCHTPFTVFQAKHGRKSLNRKSRSTMSLKALQKRFNSLSKKTRATYAAAAQKNSQEIKMRRKTLQRARLSGFLHFIKTELVSQWNALETRTKAKYNAEAAKTRKVAKAKCDKMIKTYLGQRGFKR
ncbi:hypothetical protein XU18_0936 [Perkinsela sp. CCAP 1560/4]|nr:hypothetical protein XU18_0936 [Perkinsela sp. CCAP 1560/4]|eukprot:KNH08533.1 hypothetical protein XU18_0936 [Perkinsela sp. CCAP 1560/4]